MNSAATTKAPWHLWGVGILGLLWNSFGVTDYPMTLRSGPVNGVERGLEQLVKAPRHPEWEETRTSIPNETAFGKPCP